MFTKEFYEELAAVLEVQVGVINPDFNMAKDAVWDSLACIGSIALVDQHFNMILEGEELMKISTVRELESLIRRRA